MIAEAPRALTYIFTDDIYIIPQEVVLPDTVPLQPVEDIKPVTFNYAGSYHQKVLILAFYTGHETMEPAHMAALESTIKRKELALNDVAILNLGNCPETTFDTIVTFFNPRKLLILGKDALPSGFNPPPLNQLTELSDGVALYTFSFTEMMGNRDNTKAFWDQMKNL